MTQIFAILLICAGILGVIWIQSRNAQRSGRRRGAVQGLSDEAATAVEDVLRQLMDTKGRRSASVQIARKRQDESLDRSDWRA